LLGVFQKLFRLFPKLIYSFSFRIIGSMAEENTKARQDQQSRPKQDSPKKRLPENALFFGVVAAVIIIFAALIFVFVLSPATPTGNVPITTTQDEVVAVVGSENIYLADLEFRYATVPADLQATLDRRAILDNMVENLLILQAAKKEGISATQEEIGVMLESQQEQVDQLLSDGKITQEFISKAITEFIIVNKYLDQFVFSKIEVEPEKIGAFFNENKDEIIQVRASHILVETQEEADALLKQINEGASFEDLAKEKSKDPGSAANGGDLGFFARSTVVKEFGDLAFSMNPGDVPQITESQFGFHIVKVTERNDTLAAFSEQIETFLRQEEKDTAYQEFIAKLKAETSVQILFKG